ncbi:hypothetical protein LZV53_15110, partial [Klebsiella michiganensis]|uniref:hypothetical protein n=1 Tax=Klebsiella michiganensis TaxID=1134687 RepID=UPI001F21B494
QSAGGSPGKAFTPQPGDTPGFIHRRGFPPRLALRLAGLRGVQSAGGSPGKAFTPQPGNTSSYASSCSSHASARFTAFFQPL